MNTKASRQRREQRIALVQTEDDPPRSPATDSEPDWQKRLARFPDPWLFDGEALLRELNRIRELMLNIPVGRDVQANHFALTTAIDAIWNLSQHLRYLLHLHREGQRAFANKAKSHLDSKHGKRQPKPPCTIFNGR